MLELEVNDMTCGHCADTITRAVHAVDAAATLIIDLNMHRVRIEPGHADAAALVAAIEEAGYTPRAIDR
jgi:copper chaperone